MNKGQRVIAGLLAVVAVALAIPVWQDKAQAQSSSTTLSGPPIPILEYLLDEGDGDVAMNTGSLGDTTDGEINGAVYSTDTPSGLGFSLDFDGTNDFVHVPNTFNYDVQFTVEAWIKPDFTSDQSVIWDDYGNPGVLLAINDGQLLGTVSTARDPGRGVSFVAGEIVTAVWQHVAMVYNGVELIGYINGDRVAGVATSGAVINGDNPPSIGGAGTQLSYDGLLDDIRVYLTALDPGQLGYFELSAACCLTDGICEEDSQFACDAAGGLWQGEGTTCAEVECPPAGACCLPTGTCQVLTDEACQADGGLWQGVDTTCADFDGDGRADVCQRLGCRSDSNFDGVVDTIDLLTLLADWGPCPE